MSLSQQNTEKKISQLAKFHMDLVDIPWDISPHWSVEGSSHCASIEQNLDAVPPSQAITASVLAIVSGQLYSPNSALQNPFSREKTFHFVFL